MAVNFGITPNGFVAPTYEEILDSVQDDFQSKFGNDISLESNSNFGILSRLIAWREVMMIQELQQIYYSAFVSTATDTALDRLGSNVGINRKVATPSIANIVITSEDEYLIQAGEQFETEDGIVFDLLNDVMTAQQKDGTYSGVGQVQSEDTGAMNNVSANTITVVSNPDDNIDTVTNPEKAQGGEDREDDEMYRQRIILENAAKPGPTANGIRSALLNLSGVREVGIVQNPKDEIDSSGNPPYSVHIYVLGGKEQEIAQTLADHIAAGVTLTGSKTVTVTDATGNPRDISFDFATDKQIFVQININTNDKWNNDDDKQALQQSIADSVNNLQMGQTVYLTKLYPTVYGFDGVSEASVKIGLSKVSLGLDDIKVEQFEVPHCDLDNIEVVTNGN